ncbi:hypothetical protein C8Q76DRAFT_827260 [Earliella scabrosa]|nr:hypothetical protein C8Q76DRAFT_827260 [Earliella scabrosa]
MAPSFLERHPFRRIQSSNCITFLKALKLRGVESQTVAAIRDLKTTVQVIRNAFVEVETDIRRFAEISSEDPDGGIMIEDLCTQWRELYIRGRSLLATNTVLRRSATLSDIPAIKEELRFFLKFLEEKEQKAQSTRVKFETLSRDVGQFVVKIEVVMKRTIGPIPRTLTALHERLVILHEQLKQTRDQMIEVGMRCLLAVAATAGAISIVVLTLSPEAMSLAMSSINSAVDHGVEFHRLVEHYKARKEELAKVSSEILELGGAHDEYGRNLGKVNFDIKQLSAKIDTIAGIWHSLRNDIQELRNHLEIPAHPDAPANRLFFDKIYVTRKLYKTLAVLLREYARGSL